MECVESERAMRGAAAREAYFYQGRVATEALTPARGGPGSAAWRRAMSQSVTLSSRMLAAAGSWSLKNAASY